MNIERIHTVPADLSHSQLLFNWRNDEETRKNSISSHTINWDEHDQWFRKSLLNKNRQIFIGYDRDTPLGMIRLDLVDDDSTVLSWVVSPSFRGRGVGTLLLKIACDYCETPNAIAFIKPTNNASKKMAAKCGFSHVELAADLEKWSKKIENRT